MSHLKSLLSILILIILAACGGASSTSSSDDGGSDTDNTTSGDWTSEGAALTIDDIVNGSGSSSLMKEVTTSSTAAFYFGRFIYQEGDNIHCGSIKFKLNKEDDSSAYFSDFTLEGMSTIVNGTTSTPTVTSSTDLDVDSNYDDSSNHVEIANADDRFVGFDLDFGNNDFFGDIENAGVLFSSDFRTMVGGDDANFFFIAQKVSSQPDVVNSDMVDDWVAIRFSVNTSNGAITVESTVDISIESSNSDNLNAFTGSDSELGDFNGLLGLTDDSAGCFAYTLNNSTIDGGFALAADKNLAFGYDIDSETYFAMQKVD